MYSSRSLYGKICIVEKDGTEAPKHVAAFVIKFCTIYIYIYMHLLVQIINILINKNVRYEHKKINVYRY
jgi:hypothetical protein